MDGEGEEEEKRLIGWGTMAMDMAALVVVAGQVGGVKGGVGREDVLNHLKHGGCEVGGLVGEGEEEGDDVFFVLL